MEWRVPSHCAIFGRRRREAGTRISRVSSNAEGAVVLVVPRAYYFVARLI